MQLGLQLDKELGVNPYKFGMIGSTDSHTGLATAEENNFFGKHSGSEPGADGKLPPVGNTVDVANATWTSTIGAPELIKVWTDPDFDASLRAAYYARVIEIPTPRWTAYEAKHFGVRMDPEVPMITQERAYTSPIWYAPQLIGEKHVHRRER